MLLYLYFNLGLYAIQLTLYALLFARLQDASLLRDVVYYVISFVDVAIPLAMFGVSIYFSISYSGYAFVSDESSRLSARVISACVSI
jgi:hypothetical protein